MIEFKRLNIAELAVKKNLDYCVVDILQQASIKEICERVNMINPNMSLDALKKVTLNNVEALLDLMLSEKKQKEINNA